MPKLILSFPEAAVLRAVDGGANTHQLASSTKMTPSDVHKTVNQLADRKLLILKNGDVSLTKDGLLAQRKLTFSPSSSSTSTSDVLVVDAEPADWSQSVEDIDRDIDAELEKLK